MRSLGHIKKLTSIEDDDDAFVPADEMLKRLLADNLQIAKQLRAAVELTQDKRDHPTSDLLIGILDDTEKRIWFLMKPFKTKKTQDNMKVMEMHANIFMLN